MGAEQSTPAAAAASGAQPTGGSAAPGLAPSALVICGPSGVGKNTLIKRLLDRGGKYRYSVSTTTRSPRPGEVDGQHYHFATRAAMEADVAAGLFLETAEVHGQLYGTSRAAVQDTLAAGKVALLDVDVEGARQIRAARIPALFVFVAPPSLEELERRLVARGTETPSTTARRMQAARQEISSLNERGLFDYLLLNDDLDATASQLERIAQRALAGLPAEPGQVPDAVRFEEDEDEEADAEAAAAAERISSGAGASSSSNAAAAAAAGIAAAALPTFGTGTISSTPRGSSLAGDVLPAPAATPPRTVLGDRLPASATSATPDQAAASTTAAAAAPLHANGSLSAGQHQHQQQQLSAAVTGRMAAGLAAWQDKVAVVTGASSGIGWAVCEALGRAGLRVVAVARRRERLQQLQAVMQGPSVGAAPGHFLPVVCDVTKEPEISNLPAIIAKHWGPDAGIDVLFANAGLSRSGSGMFDGATVHWLEMVSTNLLGTAIMTRTTLQDMQRRGAWGHIIVNVGLSGHRIPDAAAGGTFFAATKAAVKTMTEGLRQEARAKGLPLRVSGISPGCVATEFFTVRAHGDAEAGAKVAASLACLDPSDVADAVLWALSAPAHAEVNDIIIRPTQQAI